MSISVPDLRGCKRYYLYRTYVANSIGVNLSIKNSFNSFFQLSKLCEFSRIVSSSLYLALSPQVKHKKQRCCVNSVNQNKKNTFFFYNDISTLTCLFQVWNVTAFDTFLCTNSRTCTDNILLFPVFKYMVNSQGSQRSRSRSRVYP